MQKIVFTVGTSSYKISKYYADIIGCISSLSKTEHKVKNLGSFVSQARRIEPEEIQVSYDLINLYPLISINKTTDVMLPLLSEHYNDLKTRTKLKLIDIHQLIELCV